MTTRMTQEARKRTTLVTLLQGSRAQSLISSFQLGRNGVLAASGFYVSLSPECLKWEQKRVFRARSPEFYSWTI